MAVTIEQPPAPVNTPAASPSIRWWLLGVFALAMTVRLAHLLAVQQSPLADVLIGDAHAYDAWGRDIASGHWIGQRTFYQAPLYPYFLGTIYSLAGHHLLAVRLVQIVLGSMACVLLAMATQRMIVQRAERHSAGLPGGIISGVMLAVYPAAIFFDGLIQKSALDLPLLCLTLWLLAVGRDALRESSGRMRKALPWLGAGAALGLLMLSRENALVLVAVALAWAAACSWQASSVGRIFSVGRASRPSIRHRGNMDRGSGSALRADDGRDARPTAENMDARPTAENMDACPTVEKRDARSAEAAARWLLPACCLLLGLAAILSPVLVRNKLVGGEFHLTTSQFGPNFYIGNHAGADGTYQPLRYGRGDAAYERNDATELAQQALGRALTPGEVSAYWTKRTLDDIAADPNAYLRLLGRKFMLTFNRVELADTEGQYAWSDLSPVLRWLDWWSMGLLLPLATLGLVVGWRTWRVWWFVPVCVGVYSLSVIGFFVFARYRLPLAPMLMMPAASGIVMLPGLWREKSWRLLAGGAAVAVVAGVIAWWPVAKVSDQRGISYASFAVGLQKQLEDQGRLGDAAARATVATYYRRSIAHAPRYAAAHYNYGVLLLKVGRAEEAAAHLQRAIDLQPAQAADAWNQLGLARMAMGQVDHAIACYQNALTLRPSFAQAHNNLGVALARIDRLPQAAAHYRKALQLDENMSTAHNNLGVTLARQGHLKEAVACFEKALALDPSYQDAQANLQRAGKLLEREGRQGVQ